MLRTDPGYLEAIYQTQDHAAICARFETRPRLSGHPILGRMARPAANEHFNSGPEGMRQSCRDGTRQADPNLNGAIWMFGGSTTYGNGNADCETIASAANDLDPANRYLNFGVPAHVQSHEIAVLELLLRKGYRSKAVVFLDGLNDLRLVAIDGLDFDPLESRSRLGAHYAYQMLNKPERQLHNVLLQLPILRLIDRQRDPDIAGIKSFCQARPQGDHHPDSAYHQDPMGHFTSEQRRIRALATAVGPEVATEALLPCVDRL